MAATERPTAGNQGLSHRRPLKLSPSAIERYLACPKQFLLADIERAPRDEEEASPILCQANAIHAGLDRFFGLPQEHRSTETLERALRSVWAGHRRTGAFANTEEERHYGLEAIDLLHRFYASFDTSVRPLSREQWVRTPLDCGVTVHGKVDRIDQAAGGGLDLVDYKTGRRQLEPEDLHHDPAALVYLAAAEATYGLEVERVRFLYLRSGDEARWTPEREDVDAARLRLDKLVASISTDTSFVATPGGHCRFCPFSLRCTERQTVALDDLAPVEDLAF